MGNPHETQKHLLSMSRRTLFRGLTVPAAAALTAACASDAASPKASSTQLAATIESAVKATGTAQARLTPTAIPATATPDNRFPTPIIRPATFVPTQPIQPTQVTRVEPTRPAPTPERQTGNPETQAKTSAVNAWLASLNASKPSQLRGVNIIIKVIQMAQVGNRPISADDIVGGKLGQDADLIKISWTAPGVSLNYTDIGEAEIKTIRVKIDQPDQLTTADRANGITWKGSVSVNFVIRYRVVRNDESPAPKGSFSPWKDDNVKISVTGGNNSWQTKMATGGYASGFDNVELPTRTLVEAQGCAYRRDESWCRS